MCVSNPCSSVLIKSQPASAAAASTSASVAWPSGLPYAMFSKLRGAGEKSRSADGRRGKQEEEEATHTVPVKTTESCETRPMADRHELSVKPRMSSPSNVMVPASGSKKRRIRFWTDDLPEPEPPLRDARKVG